MRAHWVMILGISLSLLLQSCGGNGNTNNNQNNNQSGNTNNNPNTEPIEALPAATFLYIQYPKQGENIGHVYAYDTTTQKSRLVTDLDNTTRTPEISISPDRKWFALRAFFRPNDIDKQQGILIPSLWVVSVDGKQFRRVTEPILNSNTRGASCTTNAQCTSTGYCDTTLGKCSFQNYSIGLGKPQWSRDGKTLWTTQSQFWSSGSKLTGGSTLASVPVQGGALQPIKGNHGCAQVSHLSIHPTEDKLVAIHSVCTSGKPGLHLYNIPPKTSTPVFENPNVKTSLGSTLFFPDGSGVLFFANSTWDTNNDQKPDVQGVGVAGYDFKKKQLAAILPPLKTNLLYTSMTISPDSSKLVVCIFDNQQRTNNLYLLDSTNKDSPFQALIEDGKSCQPAW